MLKKDKNKYVWENSEGKTVLEFPEEVNVVKAWQGLYILKYEDPSGFNRYYVYDRLTSRLLKKYTADKISLFTSADNSYLVLCTYPGGNVIFIDKNGFEMGSYEVGQIVEDRILLSEKTAVILSRNPETGKYSYFILNDKGRFLFEIRNAEITDKLELSKNGILLTITGNNIWTKVYNTKLRTQVAQGFIVKMSSDEKYLAAVTWGADEPDICEEYAKILDIPDSKIIEAKHSKEGLYGMFVQLYFLEIYSLETGELIGKEKLEGDYLKAGRVGNPTIDKLDIDTDKRSVNITALYKGNSEVHTVTFDNVKASYDRISFWQKSRYGGNNKTKDEILKDNAKDVLKFTKNAMKQFKTSKKLKEDKSRLKYLSARISAADNKEINEILSELNTISRRYIILSR